MSNKPPAQPGRITLIAGWVLSGLTALVLLGTAAVKLIGNDAYIEQTEGIGWTAATLTTLASIQISIVVIYLVPKTAVLGAILIAGYYGGAVAAYVRLEQMDWVAPLVLGIVAWLGLYLRMPALRRLAPLRA